MNQKSGIAKGRAFRIYLLEDEPLLRSFFEETIRHWRKEVVLHSFENGDDACRELSRLPPDLLITDALHPGLDGGGLICKLAEKPTQCSVLWTSGGSDYALTPFFPKLKIEVLPKPFGPVQLREKLNLLLTSGSDADEDLGDSTCLSVYQHPEEWHHLAAR